MCKYQISHDIKIGTENVEYMRFDLSTFFFCLRVSRESNMAGWPPAWPRACMHKALERYAHCTVPNSDASQVFKKYS